MKKITSLFVAFGLAASFAVAGDGEGCPSQCKGTDAKPTALASARKALADAPKAEEKLTADQRAQLKDARDFLLETPSGKAMGASFEACGWLTIAAASQPGTSPEAAALLKDMGATYCSIAKMVGGCAECECCDDAEECCKSCKADMSAEAVAAKAKELADVANKLLAVAAEQKPTAEQMEKLNAHMKTMQEFCPVMPAMQGATTALSESFASLAKMGIPSADAKNATRDSLVKAAIELHGAMTSCHSSEGGECEGTEKAEEVVAPAKSS